MKITITPTENDKDELSTRFRHSEVSVSLPDDDMTLADVYERLINPALLGFGYDEKNINDIFNNY